MPESENQNEQRHHQNRFNGAPYKVGAPIQTQSAAKQPCPRRLPPAPLTVGGARNVYPDYDDQGAERYPPWDATPDCLPTNSPNHMIKIVWTFLCAAVRFEIGIRKGRDLGPLIEVLHATVDRLSELSAKNHGAADVHDAAGEHGNGTQARAFAATLQTAAIATQQAARVLEYANPKTPTT